ncbi:kinase-like protein [Gigaspora margarita]|uniref:Kinase-like protein n=1 Tax=Gigaspora margarita TaxID=4874 RepID=A0A8H4AUA4_GIGMA|nr:kinase-like protein [Gigaspora margarita]
MKRCWDIDPTKRPSALKIYKILAYWKNNIAAFYESDPVNYDEGKEISVPKSPVKPIELNEPFSDPTEEINEERFEHEIRQKSKFIEWDELSNISKLDEGYFGFVCKAYWTKTHSNVICKTLINLKDINSQYYSAFIHELTMQTRADLCENVVRFLGVSKDIINYRYFLIMEYANGGNLREFLKKNNSSLNWNKRLELACQITKGLCYLHHEEIIHRDLHDKNIVIHDNKAKITDFGNATSINTQTNIHNGLFGMLSFLAPELLNQDKSNNIPYCKKTDIYSLGMIFWELSSGRPPFENQSNKIELAIKVVHGGRENTNYGTPEYRNLYIECWDANPHKRPDIENVHEVLKKIMNSNILPEIDASAINSEGTYNLFIDFKHVLELFI